MIKKIYESNKKFFSYSLIGILSQALTAIPPFVIALQLSTSEYGSYSLSKMIMLFFVALLFTSSKTPFIINAQKEYSKSSKISKTFALQGIIYILSILLVLVSQFFLYDYFLSFAEITNQTNILITIALLIIVTRSLVGAIFLATERKQKSILVDFTYNLALNALILFLFSRELLTIDNIFISYIISGLVSLLIFIPQIQFRNIFPISKIKDNKIIKDYLIFTGWQIFGFIGIYLSNSGDNLVLKQYVSLDTIGIYNFIYGIYLAALSIGTLVTNYFTPEVTKHIGDIEYLKRYSSQKRSVLTLVFALCCGIVLAILPTALNLAYQDKYSSGVAPLYILVPTTVLYFYTLFLVPVLNTHNKYKFIQINNIIQVLINLVLDYILIPKFDMYGAAIATAISVVYLTISTQIYYKRQLKRGFK
jgi:O-antigen/teichoic acid export membrane protein